MSHKLIFALKYFRYILKSRHTFGHGIHSPFIYDFVRNVLFKKVSKKEYIHIEKYRKSLLNNSNILKLNDFGAGSKSSLKLNRKVSEISSSSSTREKYGKLLSRIVAYYKPQYILELGSCLGIGTMYLSKFMDQDAKIITIEGDPALYDISFKNIPRLVDKNIQFINAKFEDALKKQLSENKQFDLVFFDGNHTEKATVCYFEQCLNNISDRSVFIFDDIHWSKGMENAWEYIKQHESTKVCIDLFQFGIVFFRKELTKQHYIIRY